MIKRYLFMLLAMAVMTAYGQNVSDVLDATAKKLMKGGTYANFTTIVDGKHIWGNIAIKGDKFKITSANAITWYDGKTQWTYMNGTDEVNISNPDPETQELLNPYHFISLYKKGFSASMTNKSGRHVVTLKRTSSESQISEAVIEIDAKTSYPTNIKVKTDGQWTEFKVSGVKRVNYYASHFKFPAKQYPDAEIIDLR